MAATPDPRDRNIDEMRTRLDQLKADIDAARRQNEQDGLIDSDEHGVIPPPVGPAAEPPTEVAPPG